MRRLLKLSYSCFTYILCTLTCVAQEFPALVKPTVLPSHPLGIFYSRIDHRLAHSPVNKISVDATYSSANIWLPQVIGIVPRDAASQHFLSTVVWHKRDSVYQGLPQNQDSTVFRADGVLRTFYLMLTLTYIKITA